MKLHRSARTRSLVPFLFLLPLAVACEGGDRVAAPDRDASQAVSAAKGGKSGKNGTQDTTVTSPTPTTSDTATTSPTPTATSGDTATTSPVVAVGSGIWVDPAKLAALPMSGNGWTAVLRDADRAPGTANVADQDSNHDVYTLAAAIVCARTQSSAYCTKATNGVVSAIGTEAGGRWLAVGRNMTAYVISADLLGLRANSDPNSAGSRVNTWIRSFLTVKLAHNNDPSRMIPLVPFASGSNASAQEGAVYAAVAAYLKDGVALQRAWDAFRTYACDPTAPNRENIDLSTGVQYGWAHSNTTPCAVNPRGTAKVVPAGQPGAGTSHSIDGAIINDMRRGGTYQWQPLYTSYPWVGLEGFIPAAVILHRAGFPAFQVADQAVLRTHKYLWNLRNETGNSSWFDGTRGAEIIQLVNVAYGQSFPRTSGRGGGRTVGYTEWTHQTW